MTAIGVGPLWNGSPHPSGRAEYPSLYPAGTPIGEHLRVESLVRIVEGRLHYLVNNIGPKWKLRKCWSCGNKYSPDTAQACSFCMTPLRDVRMLMSVRWDAQAYKGFEAMVARRLQDAALITPVALYYRDGRMLALHHWDGQHALLDEVAPLPADRLLGLAHGVVRAVWNLHKHGVVLRRLGPEQVMVMPDGTPRLWDLDVFELVADEEAVANHPTGPVERDIRDLGNMFLRWCAPENIELRMLFEKASNGHFPLIRTFGRAIEQAYAQGHARPVASRASAYTDLGLVRGLNEDTWAWRRLPQDAMLYVVADGMGGHAAGEVASRIAAKVVCDQVGRVPPDVKPDGLQKALEQAFYAANKAVREEAERMGDAMGTTLVAAIVVGRHLICANSGDSRCYRWTPGGLELVSKDHSVAQDLFEQGRITAAELRTHPRAHVLTVTVGTEEEDFDVNVARLDLKPGERVVLCSDGLWGEVEDGDIASICKAYTDRREAVYALVRAAYENGGKDNTTVVLVDV